MIEKWVYARLASDPAVTAIVGQKIYPFAAPQKIGFPRVTYFRVSASREHSFDGISGPTSARVQIDSWALKYSEAKDLSDAIRLLLDAYRGTSDGFVVQGVFLEGDQDLSELPHDAKEELIYRVSQDYRIVFEESSRNTP